MPDLVVRPTTFRLLLVFFTLLSLFGSASASGSADVGSVRFIKEADSSFDSHTRAPSGDQSEWMRANYFRQKTYAPYFDERTTWYPNAWAYKDLYAVYRGSGLERLRPEWILRDADGSKLFIPWGCENGSCPQYAGDITSAAFRANWIDEARRTLSEGYRGLFIDDVNMEFRVSNGSGAERPPVDPNTGRAMTHAAWRGYVADFVEQVRRELPEVEIAHNPIWFSGHSDPDTARGLLAADYVTLERGVSDKGLSAGRGRYGFTTLLEHVDWLHARGKAVLWDAYTSTRQGAEYNLATYFLTGNGRDGVRTDYRSLPNDWWAGYNVELGAARSARYAWNGVLRRDFERGYVLVNGPGEERRTLASPAGATDIEGTPSRQTVLPAASGAVVLTPASYSPGAPAELATGAGQLRLQVVRNPRSDAVGTGKAATRRSVRLRRTVLVKGRAVLVKGGRVLLSIERRRGRSWHRTKAARTRVRRGASNFGRVFRRLPTGRYRVRASFRGPERAAVTRTRGFRLQR